MRAVIRGYPSIIIVIMLLIYQNLPAQEEKYRKIEEAKKVFLEQRLQLSPELYGKFFALYQGYSIEKRKIIKSYKEVKKIIRDSTITSEVAKSNLNKLLQIKQQELDLEKKYVDKYLVFLPPAKVAEVLIAEKDFLKILYKKVSSPDGNPANLSGSH